MLLPVPAHPFETTVVRPVRPGKQPYVSFDRNRYSIPHALVRRPVTLLADATTVRVVDGPTEVARHVRSYDTGVVVEGGERDPPNLDPPWHADGGAGASSAAIGGVRRRRVVGVGRYRFGATRVLSGQSGP